MDCSLNGDCVGGSCACDAQWTGSSFCDVMAFLPTPEPSGYHNATQASWGGNVVFEAGEYHLFVAQMTHSCPLDNYGSNSMVIRATSKAPGGPFSFQQIVWPAFAHNPTIRRLPPSPAAPKGGFVVFIIGGSPSSQKMCGNSSGLDSGETQTEVAANVSSGSIAVLFSEVLPNFSAFPSTNLL
jgi:hypothetical protein